MTEPDPDAEVADLKARRKSPAKPQGRKPSILDAAQPVREHDSPLTKAFQRNQTVLFDPSEIPPVIQAGGVVPDAVLDDRYDVAESDYSELIRPENCKTPISLSRWHAGDRVRKDIYAHWAALQGVETETA